MLPSTVIICCDSYKLGFSSIKFTVSRYANAVILNLEETWMESEPRVPLIGLLSMGSDPTTQIETLAKRHGIECRAISMGQGQEVHARRLISHSMQVRMIPMVFVMLDWRIKNVFGASYYCKTF